MKFLPENKKKTIILAFILLVSAAVIIYLNFFQGNRQRKASVNPEKVAEALNRGDEAARSGLPAANQSSQSSSGGVSDSSLFGGLLPYGSKIDIHILNSDKFKILRGVPKVTVSPEELGKDDLFAR